MSETDATEQAVRAYFDAATAPDLAAFLALFASEVHFEDPIGVPVLGADTLPRFHKGLQRAWQQLKMVPDAVHVRGRAAAATWHAEGLSATGKTIRFEGIDTFEVDEAGRIRRVLGYWDMEGMLAQM
jgi:steroid delta-isomerase